jgi:hypothetical protein
VHVGFEVGLLDGSFEGVLNGCIEGWLVGCWVAFGRGRFCWSHWWLGSFG